MTSAPSYLQSASTRSPLLLSPACDCCQKPGSSGAKWLTSPVPVTWVLHRGIRRSGAPFTYMTRLPSGSVCMVAMNCNQEYGHNSQHAGASYSNRQACATRLLTMLPRAPGAWRSRCLMSMCFCINTCACTGHQQHPALPCARSQTEWPQRVACS